MYLSLLGAWHFGLSYATKPIRVVVHANHIEVPGPVVIFLVGILMDTLGISTLLLLAGVAVGRIATRGGSRRDGDVAMAIFASLYHRAIHATVLLNSESKAA